MNLINTKNKTYQETIDIQMQVEIHKSEGSGAHPGKMLLGKEY